MVMKYLSIISILKWNGGEKSSFLTVACDVKWNWWTHSESASSPGFDTIPGLLHKYGEELSKMHVSQRKKKKSCLNR